MSGGQIVYYNLDEAREWSVTREELDRASNGAKDVDIKAIAVINPGNPSGSVLSHDDVAMIITFARDTQMVILADEVYQENVYAEGKAFHSFKKVLRELQATDKSYDAVQLVSFHSTSKGLIGECGQRGGYMEYIGFSERSLGVFGKVAATSLSPNTLGQIFVGLMVTPPKEGEPSFALFQKESSAIFAGLKRRAKQLQDGLNAIEGLSCNQVQGAMYGFPQVKLPALAIEEAEEHDIPADEYWCLRLVEETGIVCVPGSGFGQEEGTYHFRITILPPDDMLTDMLKRLGEFQTKFLAEFAKKPPPASAYPPQ
jgi:alanine transaminase